MSVTERGEELDAAIAVEVMGWGDEWDDSVFSMRQWIPSTDISHAWLIVEKVGGIVLKGSDDKQWWARTHAPNAEKHYADTAPEAICLAALTDARTGAGNSDG